MSQVEKFNYLLSKNGPITLLAFSGALTLESCADFDHCINQVFSDSATRFIVIDMSHVLNITMDLIPAFVQFQKTARNKNQEIRLCGIGPDLKEKLLKLGVIRHRELSGTMKEGLSLVVSIAKQGNELNKKTG